MSVPHYRKFDPTGNITVLVTDDVPVCMQAETAQEIMDTLEPDCEQVGFVSGASLRMMGGEFCGNASMSLGCLLAEKYALEPGKSAEYTLRVSGADGPVRCAVRALGENTYTGTVTMPLPESISETPYGCAVRFDGITHILTHEKADEALLRALSDEIDTEAVGMIETRFDGDTAQIVPLVYVKPTGTAVYEHGCGSGSAAAGAVRALRMGADGTFVTEVSQPGGIITAEAVVENGGVKRLTITGTVRMMK